MLPKRTFRRQRLVRRRRNVELAISHRAQGLTFEQDAQTARQDAGLASLQRHDIHEIDYLLQRAAVEHTEESLITQDRADEHPVFLRFGHACWQAGAIE